MNIALVGRGAARPSSRKLLYLAVPPMGVVVLAAALYTVLQNVHVALAIPAASLWYVIGVALAGLALFAGSVAWRVVGERSRALDAKRELELRNADLGRRSESLEMSLGEAEAALGAVDSHLLLIDSSFVVLGRYTNALESVFRGRELGHENLLDVLQRVLPQDRCDAARSYLPSLFELGQDDRVLEEANPLRRIEIPAGDGEGSPARFLSFRFKRVIENEVVTRVLVSIEDITEYVVSERAVLAVEQRKVALLERLVDVLRLEPRGAEGFLSLVSEQFRTIDQALSGSDFAEAESEERSGLLRRRLGVVVERVRIVGQAAALAGLAIVEQKAAEVEALFADYASRASIGGQEFLAAVTALADLRGVLCDVQTTRARLAGIERAVRIRRESGDDLAKLVVVLTSELAERSGKEVRIEADEFDSRALPLERRLAVQDVLIELTRNSVEHGIEEPDARVAAGKPRCGTIELRALADAPGGSFGFLFRDDGRGLDPAALRSLAVQRGILDANRAAAYDDAAIAGLIFLPGFSTADHSDEEREHGLGLAAIRRRVVDDCGGEIGVNSETGRSCEFAFSVPARSTVLALRA
jgi:two-component system chemotaxis sensor kinase CheA